MCPSGKIFTLMKEEDNLFEKQKVIYNDPNSEENLEPIDEAKIMRGDVELVQPDQALSIVVQKALKSTCEVEKENWVKTNVFPTNCTS